MPWINKSSTPSCIEEAGALIHRRRRLHGLPSQPVRIGNCDLLQRSVDALCARRSMKSEFRVRATPDWKRHAGELESEMLRRGMFFEIVDWSEDQASLLFE